MVAEESDGSMQWFHFFDGIFLGQWYPEGFHAKSMVLKRFTRFLSESRDKPREILAFASPVLAKSVVS